MPHTCVVGIDLGGTNVRACAYQSDGTPVGPKVERSSRAQEGSEAIFDAIVDAVESATDGASQTPTAVGVSIPGHVDDEAGVVKWSPNLGAMVDGVFHYWSEVDVRGPLESRVGMPVHFGNDANLAALGEYRFGSGRNTARCLVMLTLGTGIGGGVVLAPSAFSGDARGPLLLLGGNKGGAELGHTIIQHGGLFPNSGEYGSIEAYCARDAIVQRAVNRLRRGRGDVLRDLVKGDWSQVTPALISQAANQGDAMAIEVWKEVGEYLGVGIGNMINIFAPDVVAIGGQIVKAGKWLMEPARAMARNVAGETLFPFARIVEAEQTDDAGMLGASALAFMIEA